MSRQPRHRTVRPGLPHHIVTRGNNRRRLFSYPRELGLYLWYLLGMLEGVECVLHQITLMANHVHMIVTPPTVEALSSLMKGLNQRYAQARNRLREGSGKLFEERYWSKAITSTEQLAATTVYNDTNAYQAGLLDDPFAHRWSTTGLHAGVPGTERRIQDLWTPSAWYQGLGDDANARAAAYRTYTSEYLMTKEIPASLEGCWWLDELTAPYKRRLERPNRSSAR